MSLRRLAKEQPESFVFTDEHQARAEKIIAKYPAGYQASAVIPLLDLAQRQDRWVTKPAIEYIAAMLDMDVIRVLEVATFYTMFNLNPVGKSHIQVCTNLPCMLRGCADVVRACEDKLGVKFGGTTADGDFTLSEVECAGACVNAPIVAVDDDYYEDLDYESMGKLIDAIKAGNPPSPGSATGRQGAAPAGDRKSLTEDPTPTYSARDWAAAKQKFEEAQEAARKAKENA
ncbi:MAG: NADH-quinone oxidoreductase subunit NuoE [Rhodospirillaceae bacterium]|jgi:NADH-quinone oxidoreductase subunit E|nr:NADH-quinone oxidoreductase subunit NuoE [Rhodospirillaceae bacterium]